MFDPMSFDPMSAPVADRESATAEPAADARDLRVVASAMRHLVASAEPAVVFSSLAKQSVPAFSDECTIDIVEDERPGYRVSYPQASASNPAPARGTDTRAPAGRQLRTLIESAPGGSGPAFSGMVLHTWRARSPSTIDAAIARLLVDRAVAAVAQERLTDLTNHALETATNLRAALMSNRRIGTAIGILMASHKITDAAAFDLLRTASQRTHRKLHDIADEVVETGWLGPG